MIDSEQDSLAPFTVTFGQYKFWLSAQAGKMCSSLGKLHKTSGSTQSQKATANVTEFNAGAHF